MNPIDLSDHLRESIAAVGQKELERRTGVPQSNISAWLQGRRPMPIERQIQLAEACGLEVEITVYVGRRVK